MMEDIPPFLDAKLNAVARREASLRTPPKPMPSFGAPQKQEDPATAALRRELEEQAELKKAAGLAKLAAWKREQKQELVHTSASVITDKELNQRKRKNVSKRAFSTT